MAPVRAAHRQPDAPAALPRLHRARSLPDGVRWQGQDYFKTEASPSCTRGVTTGGRWRWPVRSAAVLRAGGVGDMVARAEALRSGGRCGRRRGSHHAAADPGARRPRHDRHGDYRVPPHRDHGGVALARRAGVACHAGIRPRERDRGAPQVLGARSHTHVHGRVLLLRLVLEHISRAERLARWRRFVGPVLVVVVTAALTIWAGYLFHVGTLAEMQIGSASVGDAFSPAVAHARVVPAPEFFHGLVTLLWFSDRIPSYALGQVLALGEVVLLPARDRGEDADRIPGAGARRRGVHRVARPKRAAAVAGRSSGRDARYRRRSDDEQPRDRAAPCAAGLSVSLRCIAGAGAVSLWHTRRVRPARVQRYLLGAWLLVASIRAHPDYLASFNELGLAEPRALPPQQRRGLRSGRRPASLTPFARAESTRSPSTSSASPTTSSSIRRDT